MKRAFILAAGLILALVAVSGPADAWTVRSGKSAMDDSPWVRLTVAALDPVYDKFSQSYRPRLHIRCLEDTTAIFVEFEGLFLGSDRMRVRYRIDDEPALDERWSISTDYYAVGRWRNTVGFVRSLIGRDRFQLEVVPYGESRMLATFNISNLENVITPLAEACHWSVARPPAAAAPTPPAEPRTRQPPSGDFGSLLERLTKAQGR